MGGGVFKCLPSNLAGTALLSQFPTTTHMQEQAGKLEKERKLMMGAQVG